MDRSKWEWRGGEWRCLHVEKVDPPEEFKPKVEKGGDGERRCGERTLWVSSSSTGGLGNRMFQLAASLGYGQRHGRKVCVWRPSIRWNPHGKRSTAFSLFPKVPVLAPGDEDGVTHDSWEEIREKKYAAQQFSVLPAPHDDSKNVLLTGFFQSPRYFPENLRVCIPSHPPAPSSHPLSSIDSSLLCFLHVRRGDYLESSVHLVNLEHYYYRCISLILDRFPDATFLVCTDDEAWSMDFLPRTYGDLFHGTTPRFIPVPEGTSDVETLGWMAECGIGGICANSSFSWWGAWLNVNGIPFDKWDWIKEGEAFEASIISKEKPKTSASISGHGEEGGGEGGGGGGGGEGRGKLILMPDQWSNPPHLPATDVWPTFATKISVLPPT